MLKRIYKRLTDRDHTVREVAALRAGSRSEALELLLQDSRNADYHLSDRGRRISFTRQKLLEPGDKVFTMGSCFAVEIRKALRARGYDAYPHYSSIAFDETRQTIGKLPVRDNVNHYNTFAIRQEFEQALIGQKYGLADLVRLSKVKEGTFHRWQDPYRKGIFAADEESILDLSGKITDCVAAAVQEADVLIITLGLTEVWRNEANGKYMNQPPREIVSGRYTFVESTYEQNYDNMFRTCSLVRERHPDKRIILTVSPVPLAHTYTQNDIVVANTESKAILRAVAATIAKEFDNVTYWPSYEIAMARDLFEQDGRHVRQDGINLIVDQFLKVHA